MFAPDFFIVGAAKAGTTSLNEYLADHPDLFLPRLTEPNRFAFADQPPTYRDHRGRPAAINRTSIVEPARYRALYADARSEQRTGDTSPTYLQVRGTAERIAAAQPNARIIVCLRHPVRRAVSAYQHLRRERREPLDLMAALHAEDRRIEENWGLLWRYVDGGRYASQLAEYLEGFGRDQVLVLWHEDLRVRAEETLRRVFEFLDVRSEIAVATAVQHNVSGLPRNRLVNVVVNPPPVVRRVAKRAVGGSIGRRLATVQSSLNRKTLSPVAVPAEVQRFILERLDGEIAQLEGLLDVRLEQWRVPRP